MWLGQKCPCNGYTETEALLSITMEDDEGATQKSQAIFEFTKRKRWADVLVSELVNVAILVLSQTGSIMHADAAAHTVTGYSEDQLLGKNFSDIIHG